MNVTINLNFTVTPDVAPKVSSTVTKSLAPVLEALKNLPDNEKEQLISSTPAITGKTFQSASGSPAPVHTPIIAPSTGVCVSKAPVSTFTSAAKAPSSAPMSPTFPKFSDVPLPNSPENGYHGFLYIECRSCGHVRGFNSRVNMKNYKCTECNNMTTLPRLVPLEAKCECGKTWRYMTNCTKEKFDFNCLSCGSPMSVEYNSKEDKYVPLLRTGK